MTDTPRTEGEAIACTKKHAAGTTHYHMTRAAAGSPYEGLIVGTVATALRERKVGLDTEAHVLRELRAALRRF